MSLHDDYGYEVDVSLKKIKGKTARPSKIKLLVKRGNSSSKKVKLTRSGYGAQSRAGGGGFRPLSGGEEHGGEGSGHGGSG